MWRYPWGNKNFPFALRPKVIHYLAAELLGKVFFVLILLSGLLHIFTE